ncbi:MAG: hypothetical protein QM757_33970 [Paludibaculum sp.]
MTTRQGVTKHLRVLEAAGLVDGRRHGRESVWAMNPDRLAEGQRSWTRSPAVGMTRSPV